MIQLATALPAITVGPVKPNAAISADVSGFALALGALMPKIAAPVAGPQGKAGEAAILLPEGQDAADAGKELPDAVLGLEGKSEEKASSDTGQDDDADGEDTPPPPSFAWFAVTPPPVAESEAKADTVPDVAVEASGKRARREIPLPEAKIADTAEAAPDAKTEAPVTKSAAIAAAPAPVAVPEARPQPVARRADAARAPAVDPATLAAAVDPEAPVAEPGAPVVTTSDDTSIAATPQPALAQAPRELRKAAADAPVVRITLDKPAPQQKVSIADVTQAQRESAVASPQSVADQIFTAFDLSQPRTAARAGGDPQADLSTLAAPTTGTQTAAAVAATGEAQDAALDTRHQQWTAKMIDKIETLQGGPVRETRLSLMPEGLGKVDIAIRQDDSGSLHVQFNTDTQAARQLIADAQPKLAEIAQERGIRLGSTSVESNATGTGAGTGSNANSQMNQGQRQDAQPQRNQPSAPFSARREAQTSTHDEERIA